MELSKHATIRRQQRGFQADDIDLIRLFGMSVKRPGNVREYRMGQKSAKRLVQAIDRIKGKAILVSDDEETVITVYNYEKN